MGDVFGHLADQPLAELNHPLLLAKGAKGAKVAAFARKGVQIFMAAMIAAHPGKAVVQIPSVHDSGGLRLAHEGAKSPIGRLSGPPKTLPAAQSGPVHNDNRPMP